MRKFLPRKMPPQRVFYGFVLPAKSHWQNKTTLWGCFDPAQTGPSESVRIVASFPVQEQEPSSPSRSPRRLRNRSSSSSSVYEVSVCEEGEEWPEGRVLPVRGYGARPRTGRHVSGFKSGCGGAARGRGGRTRSFSPRGRRQRRCNRVWLLFSRRRQDDDGRVRLGVSFSPPAFPLSRSPALPPSRPLLSSPLLSSPLLSSPLLSAYAAWRGMTSKKSLPPLLT